MALNRSITSLLSVCALLFLSGCTRWVDIDAPSSVGPSEPVPIAVTEQFLTIDGETNGNFVFPGGDELGLVFSVILPDDWTAPPTGTYSGTWDGNPFSVDADLVGSPPVSDLPGWAEATSTDPIPDETLALIAGFDCSLSPPEPPEGYQVVWYVVGPTPEFDVLAGDTSTLALEFTSGPTTAPAEITFRHATLLPAPVDDSDPIPVCIWGIDQDIIAGPPPDLDDLEEFLEEIPDRISARINDFGATPVPIMGGGMLALLAGLLVILGVRVGRRPPR